MKSPGRHKSSGGSKAECRSENDGGLTFIRVEHISCKVHVLEHEADQKAALSVTVGLVSTCSLHHDAKPEPIRGPQREFRPGVKEVLRRVAGVDDVLALAIEFKSPTAERAFVARSNSGGVAEDSAKH